MLDFPTHYAPFPDEDVLLSHRTICEQCGPVDHLPIPEDRRHCDCEDGMVPIWDTPTLRWLMVTCFCGCHQEE
jgi:hypothetical protein